MKIYKAIHFYEDFFNEHDSIVKINIVSIKKNEFGSVLTLRSEQLVIVHLIDFEKPCNVSEIINCLILLNFFNYLQERYEIYEPSNRLVFSICLKWCI